MPVERPCLGWPPDGWKLLAHTAVEAADEVRAGTSSFSSALSVGVAIGAVAIGAATVPLGATAGALGGVGVNAGTPAGGIETATAPTSLLAFAR